MREVEYEEIESYVQTGLSVTVGIFMHKCSKLFFEWF